MKPEGQTSRTLILGLGNAVRTDDAVGLKVVERLTQQDLPEGVAVEAAGTAGLGILDLITGFQRLILVDAIDVGEVPGTVLELGFDDLAELPPLNTVSSHEGDLVTILELGRRLGLDLPTEIRVVAIQVADIVTLSENCTPAVGAAVDRACHAVRRAVAAQLTPGDAAT